jgi:DeoR family transcriptional regulator, glycerol-3-phosphate regulon repressor
MKGRVRPDKAARQQIILGEARRSAALRISDLARHLGVSGETIRRDLDELGETGRLRRIYGGATLPSSAGSPSGAGRNAPGRDGKPSVGALERMAAVVAGRLEPGQTLMISGGGAGQHVARQVVCGAPDIIIITNSLAIAAVAGSVAVQVVMCPGTYDAGEDSVQGEDTIEYLGRFSPDLAVIASSALSPSGASDAQRGSANVKRAMLRGAARTILVIEQHHLGHSALQQICPLSALAEIVTSGRPPAAIAAACRRAGVKLTIA